MFDRFMVPLYFFCPIAVISFILVFFIVINPQVELINKNYKIISEINSNETIKINNSFRENITEKCNNFIDNIADEKNMKLIYKLNLTIKIMIIVLFGFTVLFIICIFAMVKGDGCYDDDYGGYCQTCQDTFSWNTEDEDECSKTLFSIISVFFLICTGIVVLSILSVYYSSKFEDKMLENCGFIFDKNYKIGSWKASKIILPIISSLFLLEIIFCIYSLCYAIIKFK